MSVTRKRLLLISAIIAFVVSLLELVLFVLVVTNIFSLQTFVLQAFESSFGAEKETMLNILSIYTFASVVSNLLFGHIYISYANQHYVQFKKGSKWLVFTLHLLVSGVVISPLVFLFAVVIKPSATEVYLLELEQHFNKSQKSFSKYIQTDPRLFVMSVQIGLLKHKLDAKEISQEDYTRLLNEIIELGVQ